MSYNSKYTGTQVEQLLDQVASGNVGGGGGITSETDPIFSASPAAGITDEDISSWNDKVDKVDGKQLSTEDFTTLLKQKLDGLSNYDDTAIQESVSKLRTDLDTLVSGDTTTAIKTFNEVIAFLDGLEDSEDLASIIASIERQIAAKQDVITDLGAIRSGAALGATALQSYTEQYKGTVTGITMNGVSKGTGGVVDLGTVIVSHQDISGKLDTHLAESMFATKHGLDTKQDKVNIVYHGNGDTTFQLTPNVYHKWNTVSSLSLTLGAPEDVNIYNEYMFEFGSPSEGTTLSLPESVEWVQEPSIEGDTTYQCSIVNNLGVIASKTGVEPGHMNVQALADGVTVSLSTNAVEYSIDNGSTWTSLDAGTASPAINKGQKIYFRATGLTPTSSAGVGTFTISGDCAVGGNVMSLLFGDDYATATDLTGYTCAFYKLFFECTSIKQVEEGLLPATTLANYCYGFMFRGCTSLVNAPALPATTLASRCYSSMFYGCTSLVNAPVLPATALPTYCYQNMFNGCTKLSYIKAMFTIAPSTSYTSNWVNGVASSGTFVKNSAATWDVVGVNGVPSGWTVQTASS